MSKQDASKLAELLKKADKETVKRAVNDPEAFIKEQGFNCTAEEVKEIGIGMIELDDDELDSVNGGWSLGVGSCSKNTYTKACGATVEMFSWCSSNDWCEIWDNTYTSFDKSCYISYDSYPIG